MTIKDLCNFTNKNQSTIGRWIQKSKNNDLQNAMQNATKGKPAEFTLEEVEQILKAGTMSKDAVNIIMNNAYDSQNEQLQTNNKEIPLLIDTVNKLVSQNKEMMTYIMQFKPISSETEVKALPEATETLKVRERNPNRIKLNDLVNSMTKIHGLIYSAVWSKLYAQLKEETGIDIKGILYIRNKTDTKIKAIDIIEDHSLFDKCTIILLKWEKPSSEPQISMEEVFGNNT